MIAITLLLFSFLQMAFGGLPSPYSGCYVGVKPPVETQCHQVIDAFSQNDRTGYITLKGDNSLRISVGSCEGTLINKRSSSISVNEATLAVDMTDRIFNHCVLHKMWGQIETDDYIIEMQYTGPEVRDITAEGHTKPNVSGRDEDVRGPTNNRRANKADLVTEQKRDLGGNTTCFENLPGVAPLVPNDCHGAILGLTDSNATSYLAIAGGSCAEYVHKGCAASVCNDDVAGCYFGKRGLASLFEGHVFKPCVLNMKYGSWVVRDGDMDDFTLSLSKAPRGKA